MEDDDDRRNPPALPSNYVTLVQLQERWLQEKQRKQREKEEQEEQERKQKIEKEEEEEEERRKLKEQEEEEEDQQQQKANLQKRQAESITTLPRQDHRPPLRTNRWIPAEKGSTQSRAVVVCDGESKSDAFMKKKNKKKKNWDRGKQMRGKPRVEEDLICGTEQLLVQKEDLSEENPVVSTESDCEKRIGEKCEAVSSSGAKRGNGRYRRGVKNRGKPRVQEDLTNGKEQLAKNKVEADNIAVVSTERECEKGGATTGFAEIGQKCVEVSSGGGRGRNGRFARGVKKWGNKRVEKELNIDEVKAGDFAVDSTEREGELKGNGKSLVVDGRVWEKKVMGGDGSVGFLGKFEGLSGRGGKGGNARFAGDMNCGSRCIGGRGRVVNRQRVERPSALNLMWVKKKEGESSDANVARA